MGFNDVSYHNGGDPKTPGWTSTAAIDALALLAARTILASGGGFEAVMTMLAVAACFIVLAGFVLPARSGAELDAVSDLQPAE